MQKNPRRFLLVIFAGVFLLSSALLLRQTVDYRSGESVYDEAAALASAPNFPAIAEEELVTFEEEAVPLAALPEEITTDTAEPAKEEVVWVDPYADALAAMDFTALQNANDDVFGWITIPTTRLSYPLLQGEDNEYYLNRTWRKGRNSVGAIFMDYRASRDLSDFHTVIYGHRMNNRSMFGTLLSYADPTYLAANPTVYIADKNGSHAYDIFAVYEAENMATYKLDFADDSEKLTFLNYCVEKSLHETGITPEVDDRILTLSTCTGNGHDSRWVVQAALREE